MTDKQHQYGIHNLRSGGASTAVSIGLWDRWRIRYLNKGRSSEKAGNDYIKDTVETRLNIFNNLGF